MILVFIMHMFGFFQNLVYAQEIVQRVELKIAPFMYDYSRFDPFEDLDSADLTIIIKESALLHFSNDKFYNILKSSDKKIINYDIATDYRIKCTIFLRSGKSELLYMNRFGEFLYQRKIYQDSQIKKFIFDHIPLVYKDE